MSSLLITRIKTIAGITEPGTLIKKGKEMSETGMIHNAWLFCKDGLIADFGSMDTMPEGYSDAEKIDASNGMLLPCFVDSHTHIVFAKSREEEFVMRIKGHTYEEIAAAGGGILNSAAKLRQCSEDELFESALQRLNEVIGFGTGAIEIKSGYGLTVADELKILRVIKRLKEVSPISIKATFLGAHAFPMEFKENHQGYINQIIDEMLPAIAAEGLADYIDVFCDKGFFTPQETETILEAGAAYGLKAKIHANELGYTGGVQIAAKMKALSADHLEYCGEEEITCLKASGTIPVGLPNCSFFLGIPYAPGRRIIDSGLPFCLASDYNPGSSPSGKMGLVMALACTQMKLTPEEAFNACTINGAAALELSKTHGSIEKGKLANLIITKDIPGLSYIPYAFGSEWISKVILKREECAD